MADIKLLKQIREETQASIIDIKKALEETNSDCKKALEWLKKRGIEKAEKKATRETSQGLVECYTHQTGRVGAMIELLCETDFVAKTEEFKGLAHELAMQVTAMNPKDASELLKQDYIKDSAMTIEELIKSVIGKLGENITVRNIQRFEI
ncbi:translation elongation factor Ts [Patescibacteria group bacterium]|nr:translation elongation factor Ts [Patescibacteria group bacterium]